MTYPADIHSRDGLQCYAAEAANRIATKHRVSVHGMLRSTDSAADARARRELVDELVQRAWRLDAIERWYNMRPGAAAEALRLPYVALPPDESPPAEPEREEWRRGRPRTRTRPTCACGFVGPLDANDRFPTERRLAKWGSPEYLCRTCAGLRIRARTDARRAAHGKPPAMRRCTCGFPLVDGRCFGCEAARAAAPARRGAA